MIVLYHIYVKHIYCIYDKKDKNAILGYSIFTP